MTLSNPAQYISGRTVQEQMNSLIDYVDQRAADVALDAIASDVAQVHQDMLDADADAADAHTDALAAAASASAAAGTLANAVKKTGEASQSIQGDVNVVGDFTAGVTRLNGATAINANLSVVGDLSVSNDATLSGTTSVLTQATGTYSAQAASGLKVKNELDNYAPMVRTTGNQSIGGNKTFESTYGNIALKSTGYNLADVPTGTNTIGSMVQQDTNGENIYSILYGRRVDNSRFLNIALNKIFSGTNKASVLQLNVYEDGHANLRLTDVNGVVKLISDTSL